MELEKRHAMGMAEPKTWIGKRKGVYPESGLADSKAWWNASKEHNGSLNRMIDNDKLCWHGYLSEIGKISWV